MAFTAIEMHFACPASSILFSESFQKVILSEAENLTQIWASPGQLML